MNCYDIVSRAFRRLGVLAAGDKPGDAELADAMDTLRAIYWRLLGNGAFGELTDAVAAEGVHDAQPGTRIMRDDPDNSVIDLPNRAHDKAVVQIADTLGGGVQTYIFDRDLARWVCVEALSPTSEAPFCLRDPVGLAATLAMELSDEYGQPISQTLQIAAARWHLSIIADFSRPEIRVPRPENYF